MSRKKVDTRGKLLDAALSILEEDGLAALNSNAVVERAGVTPPTFYHYFKNKQILLRELGERLMLAQSEVLRRDTGMVVKNADDFYRACSVIVRGAYAETRAMKGSYALLVSLRAIPELRDIRLNSHQEMAQLISRYLFGQGLTQHIDERVVAARLAIEFLYAAIEMLYETGFNNEDEVLEMVTRAHFNLVAVKDKSA